ncbi:MAG: NAD(P)H-hydrate dehydratase [Candidatus Aminicenantia bacterium]
MKILNSSQMREIDNKAINEIGIPGVVLMENAGRSAYEEIVKRFPDFKKKRMSILCGKGNNGGDGFVIARHLINHGANPDIYLFGNDSEVKGDARINLSILLKMKVKINKIVEEKDWEIHKEKIRDSEIIIDAIFGTGFQGGLGPFWEKVFSDIETFRGYKIAIDIPSGLSSDSYFSKDTSFKADLTIAMASPKIPHIFPPASERVGEVVVADIGIPEFLFENPNYFLELVTKEMISNSKIFKRRRRDSHKGDYGHVVVIGGSIGKTGASILAGLAVLKAGAALVTVATPKSCLPIIASSTPELMTFPVDETDEGTISENALPDILKFIEDKDVVVMGPGITTHPSTVEFVFGLIDNVKVPLVIDADGLNALSFFPSKIKGKTNIALTPHPGELGRVLKISPRDILQNRIEIVRNLSMENKCYVALKGWRTLISEPNGMVFVNPNGNPGMATGGSGDVLSGVIGGILAQTGNILESLIVGIYLHGLSGDIGAQRKGEVSLTALDILEYLPDAIGKFSQ